MRCFLAWRRRSADERGFVLVMTAIVLTVLMTMAAFAVDIGAWYSRAAHVQRAADAAALAGVVYMPQNLARAQAVALETAAKNGFTDPRPNQAGDPIDIDVRADPNIQQRLRVKIQDHNVPAYFASAFMGNIEIGRDAVAHYAEPIPLGSPENMLGVGPQLYPPDPWNPTAPGYNLLGQKLPPQNFYLAVNGRCAAAEEGDLLLSQFDGNALSGPGGQYGCLGDANPTHDVRGYVFNIDFDAPLVTTYKVQIWDPAYNPAPNPNATQMTSKDYTLDGAGSYSWNGTSWVWAQSAATSDIDTTFRLTAPDSGDSPLDYTDDTPVVPAVTYTSKQAGLAGQWVDFATLGPTAAGGTYRMTAFTDTTRTNSWGVNVFAIRVLPSYPGFGYITERFSTLGAGAFSSLLPKVYGIDHLSVYANAASSSADMYLAQIATVHAGKRIRLDLWDPGEGGKTIQIKKPDGGLATFNWRTADGMYAANGVTSLDLGSPCLLSSQPGNYPQPVAPAGARAGRCKFNGRSVIIEFDVDPTYTDTVGGGWWKIRYDFHAAPVSDRTTWQIRVEGDPVHLVDDGT
jgi:hypothetical protein